MKKSDIGRWIIEVFLIIMIYFETGIFTTIFACLTFASGK